MKRLWLPPLLFSVRLPTMLAMFWRSRIHSPTVSGPGRKEPDSFIVFRLDSLGDVVMTTPLFRALKQGHPRSRCTVVVQRSYKSLLATNPHIDEILTLPIIRPAWLPRGPKRLIASLLFYWTKLRKRHFAIAISPRWDVDEDLATFLCLLTNATTRVGYSERATAAKQEINRGFDRAYSLCLPPGPVQHEVLRNLAVAEALGATACDSGLEIHLTERDRRRAARLLAKVPGTAKAIALGIGAQSPGRRWPLQRYAETIHRLRQVTRAWPVIVCSESEFGDALELARLLRCAPVIVSGARLRDVCAVLERCEVFIGNDSGCAHLAAAMRCKTIVVSRHPRNGNRNHFNSPVRFAPLGRQVYVLQPAAGLDACREACCSPKPHCITAVSVDEVAAAAQVMLGETRDTIKPFATKSSDRTSHILLQVHSTVALRQAVEELHVKGARPLA